MILRANGIGIFIDAVHARDNAEIAAGKITPTHMFAVLQREGASAPPASAQEAARLCVRKPDRVCTSAARNAPVAPALPNDASDAGPHSVAEELAIALERLREGSLLIRELTFGDSASSLAGRTQWALSLDRQVEALRLDRELAEQTAWASGLDRELEERTAWALQQLAAQTRQTVRLQKEISRLVRNPFRLAYEIAAAFWLRVAFNLKTRYGFDS